MFFFQLGFQAAWLPVNLFSRLHSIVCPSPHGKNVGKLSLWIAGYWSATYYGLYFGLFGSHQRVFQFKLARDNLHHNEFAAGNTVPVLLQCPPAAVAATCWAAPAEPAAGTPGSCQALWFHPCLNTFRDFTGLWRPTGMRWLMSLLGTLSVFKFVGLLANCVLGVALGVL